MSATRAAFAVKSLDHVVLTVRNIQTTVNFYTTRLGMSHENFESKGEQRYVHIDRLLATAPSTNFDLSLPPFQTIPSMLTQVSHALKFGNQKINLHLSGHEFEPKAGRVQPGSGDLCFITDHPITDVLSSWKAAEIEVLEGGEVVNRTGAVGKLQSVYCRDPDGNLIE